MTSKEALKEIKFYKKRLLELEEELSKAQDEKYIYLIKLAMAKNRELIVILEAMQGNGGVIYV